MGAGLLILLTLLAWLGPLAAPWGFTERDYTSFLQPPSARHWFGTDGSGRDLYVITLVGLRKSLLIGLLVAVLTTALAAVVGAITGYFPGLPDRLLTWLTDLALVVPPLLVLAVLFPIVDKGGWVALILLPGFGWMVTPAYPRRHPLPAAPRIHPRRPLPGCLPTTIIIRHLLPNLPSLLVVDVCVNVMPRSSPDCPTSDSASNPRRPSAP